MLAAFSSAVADTRGGWSLSQLSDAATLIVRADVIAVHAQWDPGVNGIYTYATVDVSETWKGRLSSSRLVVKILGGRVDDVELRMHGAPHLTVGEDVALWLEVRPRDGTLYPGGMATGVRQLAGADTATVASLRAIASASTPRPEHYVVRPAELRAQEQFSYLPPAEGGPGRWHEADTGTPVAVDFQAPPGGLGGGLAEIDAAIALWNRSGINLQLQRAAARGPRCLQTFEGNGRISIAFNDPCAEISDSGSIVGLGGAYMTPIFRIVGGVSFSKIVQGMLVLNNSAGALDVLSRPGCFQDAIVHNLGHAIGLGHSERSEAIMWPDPQPGCASGASVLAADDLAGIRSIYQASSSTGSVHGAPSNLSATISGTTVTLMWTAAVTGGAVQTYVIEAGSAPGLANLANTATSSSATSVSFPAVPPGTYFVRVRGRNALGSSAPTADVIVSVGCTPALPPTTFAFSKSGLVVTFTWQAPTSGPAPTGYRLLVGSAPGLSNLLISDQGPVTGLTATGPPGTYFVRVASLSACGASGASNELTVVIP